MGDENFDDQEVELLDENIQPDNTELVSFITHQCRFCGCVKMVLHVRAYILT
jgi:hypothetical protein